MRSKVIYIITGVLVLATIFLLYNSSRQSKPLAFTTPSTAAPTFSPTTALPPAAPAATVAPTPTTTPPTTTPPTTTPKPYYAPAAVPAQNCPPSGGSWMASINQCRAAEHLAAMVLPDNWAALTPAEQIFVMINLERVNRGELPFLGLSANLDQSAAQALGSTQPPVASPGWLLEGTLAARGWSSPEGAIYGWIYDDGPGGTNQQCTATTPAGCWGHREVILRPNTSAGTWMGVATRGTTVDALVAASGPTPAIGAASFTWTAELAHFAVAPASEVPASTTAAVVAHTPAVYSLDSITEGTTTSLGTTYGLTMFFNLPS